jgi:hypothetical protein
MRCREKALRKAGVVPDLLRPMLKEPAKVDAGRFPHVVNGARRRPASCCVDLAESDCRISGMESGRKSRGRIILFSDNSEFPGSNVNL